jgi:NAD(P)-dependent dehydrogenase (short-subunit alcohol dehydrogenase family)
MSSPTNLILWFAAQHYLIHLLRDKLVESQSRIVVVSSGIMRQAKPGKPTSPGSGTVPTLICLRSDELDKDLRANSGADSLALYAGTKFVQLLGAHWWRRQLAGSCTVLAVSPGLIPGTGLGRGSGFNIPPGLPDAKSVPEGKISQSMDSCISRKGIC